MSTTNLTPTHPLRVNKNNKRIEKGIKNIPSGRWQKNADDQRRERVQLQTMTFDIRTRRNQPKITQSAIVKCST